MEYTALSTGCNARRAFLMDLGVTARLTARPGCMARRTLRGISSLEKNPIVITCHGGLGLGPAYGRPRSRAAQYCGIPGRTQGCFAVRMASWNLAFVAP